MKWVRVDQYMPSHKGRVMTIGRWGMWVLPQWAWLWSLFGVEAWATLWDPWEDGQVYVYYMVNEQKMDHMILGVPKHIVQQAIVVQEYMEENQYRSFCGLVSSDLKDGWWAKEEPLPPPPTSQENDRARKSADEADMHAKARSEG